MTETDYTNLLLQILKTLERIEQELKKANATLDMIESYTGSSA